MDSCSGEEHSGKLVIHVALYNIGNIRFYTLFMLYLLLCTPFGLTVSVYGIQQERLDAPIASTQIWKDDFAQGRAASDSKSKVVFGDLLKSLPPSVNICIQYLISRWLFSRLVCGNVGQFHFLRPIALHNWGRSHPIRTDTIFYY